MPTAQAHVVPAQEKSMEELVALCKRRGFVYQASEIYGGLNGFWDYGPLGTLLKNNLRDAWWEAMVLNPPRGPDGDPVSIVGLDSAIIQNPKTWEASGHVAGFNDPMVDDKDTKRRFRADHLYGVFSEEDPLHATGGSDTADSAGRTVSQWKEAVPNRTVVASTAGEAATLLIHDKALRKSIGIRSCEIVAEDHGPMEWVTVKVDLGGGRLEKARIEWVSQRLLERAPERVPSPFTGKPGALTSPRAFNLMLATKIGATATEDDKAYLRPETAQGIFLNWKNIVDTTRVRVPFGIAQIGKAFRNEVTPRNFIFRSREFEQMEMEFFCHPDEAKMWFDFWTQQRLAFWKTVGVSEENLQLRQHETDELSHYAKEGVGTCDIECKYPFTAPEFGELEGVAHRTDFDLRQHQEHSGAKLEYFDQERNERYMPHVIEPAAGLTRGVLAILCDAFTPDPERPSKVFMRFTPRMAPIKAAVFPLVNKDGMPEKARALHDELRARSGGHGMIDYDPKQSIGKRYARMDEAGCPFCFTIDGDTLQDDTVTVRDRDTASQERINIAQVPQFLSDRLGL